jgi:hypothetical protein
MPPNEPHERRWKSTHVADVTPGVAVLAGHGLFQAGAVAWGVWRDGLPVSTLGCNAFVSDAAAALLAVVGSRRPVYSWMMAVVGVGAAVADAGLWVAIGGDGHGAARYARQIVVAVGVRGLRDGALPQRLRLDAPHPRRVQLAPDQCGPAPRVWRCCRVCCGCGR